MPETWELANPNYTENEERLGVMADNFVGKQFPSVPGNMKKTFSLYRFIVAHMNSDPSVLQSSITENGKPMFSIQDIHDIMKILKRHSS